MPPKRKIFTEREEERSRAVIRRALNCIINSFITQQDPIIGKSECFGKEPGLCGVDYSCLYLWETKERGG